MAAAEYASGKPLSTTDFVPTSTPGSFPPPPDPYYQKPWDATGSASDDRKSDKKRKDKDDDYRKSDKYSDTGSKFSDSKYNDSKYSDSKYSDNKYDDGKYKDSKYSDSKYDDGQYKDNKYNNVNTNKHNDTTTTTTTNGYHNTTNMPDRTRPQGPNRASSTAIPGHTDSFVMETTSRPAEQLAPTSTTNTLFEGASLQSIRLATELSIQELINIRQQFPLSTTFSAAGAGPSGNNHNANVHKIRAYHDVAMSDLYLLRKEISNLTKTAESQRTRKFVFGVLIASFIPAVRKIFRRSSEDKEANDTEYAFSRTRALLERIKQTVTPGSRTGWLAQMALAVCAILYVFQNEVTIRVARTMNKRLKKLAGKIEGGIEVLDEEDLKDLKGWRWRVLMW